MNKRFVFIVIVSCFSLVISYYAFYRYFYSEQVIIFESTRLKKHAITQNVSAAGTLEPEERIIIGSFVEGKVIKIFFDNNDPVKKGDVLAELDNGIGDSNLKKAIADRAEALAILTYQKSFFKRQVVLYKANQLSQDLYQRYQQDEQLAQARFDQAHAIYQRELSLFNNLKIISPDDGIVIAKKINIGQMITSRLDATALFEIAKDLHSMEVYLDIDEADVGLVKKGQSVSCRVDAFPTVVYDLIIDKVEYQVKQLENIITYRAIARIENKNLLLRPGMTVNAEINVADNQEALVVPNKAFRINSKALKHYAKRYNYKLEQDDSLKKKLIKQDFLWIKEQSVIKQIPVIIGAYNYKYSEIKQGLTIDQDIITNVVEKEDNSGLLKGFFTSKVGG